MKMHRFFVFAGLVTSLSLSMAAQASISLPVGAGPVSLPGSTTSAEADLEGKVISERSLPFQIKNSRGALLFKGKLQSRVVQSSTQGDLHFYYRIHTTKKALKGIIKSVTASSYFPTKDIQVDWRTDGLGQLNPLDAQRNPGDGRYVKFQFDAFAGGAESKFFYIKTTAKKHKLLGQVKIQLTTGEFKVLKTSSPVR